MDDEHDRLRHAGRDRREILDRVVRELAEELHRPHRRAVEEDRVPVRGLLRDVLSANRAAVVDDDLTAERGCEALRGDPREDVRRAAGFGGDDTNDLRRVLLRGGRSGGE
jgi:hypothetical protein